MRRALLYAALGALTGVALQYLLSIFISIRLQLGYLMAYIAPLAEMMHGELPAVLLEAGLSALLGMGCALAIFFAGKRAWPRGRRFAAALSALLLAAAPAVLTTLSLLRALN